jgi:hypothetical protein
MSSPGSIQELPLESIPKRLETAFLWEHTFDSIASLCNNGVNLKVRKKGSGIGFSLFHFMMIHENAPFSMTVLESSICIWKL